LEVLPTAYIREEKTNRLYFQAVFRSYPKRRVQRQESNTPEILITTMKELQVSRFRFMKPIAKHTKMSKRAIRFFQITSSNALIFLVERAIGTMATENKICCNIQEICTAEQVFLDGLVMSA
jgi:hypothetical protein